MKKALLLLALTIACAHSANDAPFAALESVSGERFAAVANRIEYQNMMLLPEYAVTARHYYLAPGDAWLAHVQQGDNAARAWQGKRKLITSRSADSDRIEWWTDDDRQRAAALIMSNEAVDNRGNHLLAWITLSPAQGRQDAEAVTQAMLQALAQRDSARMAALLYVPAKITNHTRYRNALQQCLRPHLHEIGDSEALREDGHSRAIRIHMQRADGTRDATLPLQKSDDGYAFILDTDAFSHCQKKHPRRLRRR